MLLLSTLPLPAPPIRICLRCQSESSCTTAVRNMSDAREKPKSRFRRRGGGGSATADKFPFDNHPPEAMMGERMAERMARMMSELMMDPEGVAERTGRPGLAYVGRPVPKEQMLKMHREARASVLRGMSENGIQVAFSTPYSVKPKMPKAEIEALRPICVKDLSVETTHKGCALDGVLLELPVVMSGVHLVAEDKNGDAFMLSVYNIPGMDLPTADRTFPVGARVKVMEPFYKAVNSGGFGVRVEDPSEIKVCTKNDTLDHREEGNRLFGLKDFAGASEAYTDGLKEAKLLSVCLANASACCLELDRCTVAFTLAVSSLTVSPTYDKAWYRGLTCLAKMGRVLEARKFYSEAPREARAVLKPLLEGMPGLDLDQVTSKTSKPFDLLLEESLESLLPAWDSDAGKPGVLDAQLERLKERGNAYFRSRDFEKALGCYLSAVHAHTNAEKLLSNRAACYFKLSRYLQAALDATTAVVVGGENVEALKKPLFRRASALRELGLYTSALDTVDFASSHGVRCNELVEVGEELEQLVDLEPQGRRGATRRKFQQPTLEDRWHEAMQEGTVPGSHMAPLNDMLTLSGVDTGMLNNQIPKFHREFFEGGHLPPHCNANKCQEWALSAFEETRSSPLLTKTVLSMASRDDVTPEYILRRLGSSRPEDLLWWIQAPMGDVRDLPGQHLNCYTQDCLHSFANTWPRPIDLRFGKTHVAVGYVDLGVLTAANYVGSKEAGAIKFVGYEASVYCTAKTGVLAQMFRMGAPVDCILQVWYSSAWSSNTMKSFRSALLALMKEGSLPASALAICKFWLGVPHIPLLTSQEKWLELHPLHSTIPGNLVKKFDRMEVMQYMLTGRLLQEECEVGSVVMFGNPPDIPHVAADENATYLVSLDEMTERIQDGSCNSVMSSVVAVLRGRIAKVRDLFLDGNIDVELRLQSVTEGDESVQSAIAALHPWTMSWSNLCDFCSPASFHKMLKACSVHNTVHHMHTMNWVIQVKGMDLNDYVTFQSGHPSQHEVYISAKKWLKEKVKKSAKGILAPQLVYHPNNMVMAYHAKKFFDAWFQKFLKAGNITKKQTGKVHIRDFGFFCRAQGTAYMSFTYDDEIRSA